MMFTKPITVLCILFLPLIATAQESIWSFEPSHYSIKEGLNSNEIYQVFQDSKGYIWLATNRGVCKYNGQDFKYFTTSNGLLDNTVFGFYEDNYNRLWVRSFQNKLCYIKNDSVYPYKYNDVIKKNIDPKSIISSICFENNNLLHIGLFGNRYGEIIISNSGTLSKSASFSQHSKITWFVKNINDEFLFGNSNNRALQREKDNLIIYSTEDKDSILLNDSPIKIKVAKNSNHDYFLASEHFLYKIRKGVVINKLSFKQQILSVFIDKDDKLWLGTANGVWFYKNGMDKVPIYFLKHKKISSFLEDNEGSIWISTLNDGLYHLRSKDVLVYQPKIAEESNLINSLSNGIDSTIWVCYSNGVIEKISSERVATYNISNEIKEVYDVCPISSDSAIIASGYPGLNFIIGEKHHIVDKTRLFNFKKIIQLNKKNLFAGCNNSGILFFNNKGVLKSFHNDRTLNQRINHLAIDSGGTLWLAGFNELWSYNFQEYERYGNKHSLLNTRINKIIIGKNNSLILILSSNGLAFWNGKKTIHITEKDGLSSNIVTSAYLSDNTLWVGTNKGVDKVSILNWEPFKYHIENGEKIGAIPKEEVRSITCDDKNIWIAFSNKVLQIPKSKINPNQIPPRLFLKEVSVNDSSSTIKQLEHLAYNKNNLTFSFESLNFKNEGKIKLQYRIPEISQNWHQVNDHKISLMSLSSGEYTLEVYSINESDTPSNLLEYKFNISTPWWFTWWFISIALCCTIFLIVIIFKWRLNIAEKRINTEKKLLELEKSALQSQMNPHFIFNALNSIQKFISENDKKNAEIYLSKFASLIRSILESSRSSSFSLENEVELLKKYLEIEQNRFKDKFEFTIKIDHQIDLFDAHVPAMIIHPFVENAIIHGIMNKEEKGTISIEFLHESKNFIKCIVDDDGIGREKAQQLKTNNKHNSVGVLIAKERLKLLTESMNKLISVNIVDKKSTKGLSLGTQIEILIPLIDA